MLCFLSIVLTQAQTINTSYKTAINAKFAGIDKTKVPHKLLINQGMEFAELTDYSGAITNTNWATRGKFTDVYNTLLMSRTQTAVTGLVNPTVFKTNWDNLRAPNKIVLSGLYYKYSKFKPNAYPNFLVNNAGVITDKYIGGVWQNPYIDQQVFAIAAPILVYQSLSLQVTLPASLWYTNQATLVQSIAIDFGNGAGYQIMTLGQVRTINYATSGIFEWKYKLTLTNAQILNSHSKLKIDIPVLLPPQTGGGQTLTATNPTILTSQAIVNPPPPLNCPNVTTIPFAGTRQYLGIANSANLQIDYANDDCVFRRPLIVVEGFDSGLLGTENIFGEKNYISFINSLPNAIVSNLRGQIDQYDIIYINFNKGRDDLKRNAYLVEDIIKWVNTQKAQQGITTPNVVIGQSMGGVIARYALRDMEVLGQAHQTNLFVSHDAPQQGANIPLGVQYFARHLGDQFVDTPLGDYQIGLATGSGSISINDIQSLLNAQGTKQLLANTIDSNLNLNNTVFNIFQAELRTLGYPTQTRNIALSNGNHCANTQEFQPSATLFSLTGGASQTALTTAITSLLQSLTGIGFGVLAYEFNEPGLLLGLLPGSSSFDMDFQSRALPIPSFSYEIYHGNITYTKKIFSLFGWNPQITTTLTNRSYNNPVNLSYDYYPGGKYQLPFNFQGTQINNDWINVGVNIYLAPSFNFIPVTSSLDIGSGASQLGDSDFLRKYNSVSPPTGNKASPFVNFTTSFPNIANINEPHISFNIRNGNWLATELDTNTNNNQIFDCSYICNDAQITGINTICTSANYTFPASAGTTYSWSINQNNVNLVTLTGNNTQNATLTRTSTNSGPVTITLIMSSETCGTQTLTKTIWVGSPAVVLVSDSQEYCDSKWHYVNFIINNTPYSTFTLQGVIPQPLAIQYGLFAGGSYNTVTLKYGTGFTGNISIGVVATNTCGYYEEDQFEFVKLCSQLNTGGGNRQANNNEVFYKIYPNPATNIVNIDLKDENLQPQTNSEIIAELFNIMGEIKGNVKITNNIASIYTLGLPKGIYVLKIIIDGETESHQVAIQ